MAGQYDRLLTASHMPNVTIGIVPPRTQLAVIPLLGFLTVDDLAVVEMPTPKTCGEVTTPASTTGSRTKWPPKQSPAPRPARSSPPRLPSYPG